MDKHLFLWGAPCRTTQQETQLLELRGYSVRTLATEFEYYATRVSPRERLRIRACAMMQAAAVVVDNTMDQGELRQVLLQCKAMGVRCVFTHELPAQCPRTDVLMDEVLDALDHSHVHLAIPSPTRMAVPPTSRMRRMARQFNMRIAVRGFNKLRTTISR